MNTMYQFGQFYYGDGIPDTIHLREACANATTLTPDFTTLSGFTEIHHKPMLSPHIDETQPVGETVIAMATDLINHVKRVIVMHWDPHQRHCIAISAGRNIRILLMCLRDLIREGFDIGDYELRIHQHEHIYARDLCKELGFPLDHLIIWREATVDQPDHYRFAELDCHPNACYGPPLQWFEPTYDYTNTVYVSCGIAGALFWYPYYSNWGTLSMALLEEKLARVHYSEMFYQARWEGRLFNPFMDASILGYLCAVPDWVHQQPDLLRTEMIRQLGYTLVPLIYGHKYNWQFSAATRERIRLFYLHSRYNRTFHVVAHPELFVGHITHRNHHDMQALGMALMYEGVLKEYLQDVTL